MATAKKKDFLNDGVVSETVFDIIAPKAHMQSLARPNKCFQKLHRDSGDPVKDKHKQETLSNMVYWQKVHISCLSS